MTDKLISTSEAAKLIGRTPQNIRWHLPPDKQEKVAGILCNYYYKSRVLAIKLNKVKPRNRKPTRYKSKSANMLDDVHGVMVKPQYRGRLCPVCRAPVETGQYKCADCKAKNPPEPGRCDDGYVY